MNFINHFKNFFGIPYTRWWVVTASKQSASFYDTIRVSVTSSSSPKLDPDVISKVFSVRPEHIDIEEVDQYLYDRLTSYTEYVMIGGEIINV